MRRKIFRKLTEIEKLGGRFPEISLARYQIVWLPVSDVYKWKRVVPWPPVWLRSVCIWIDQCVGGDLVGGACGEMLIISSGHG